MGKMLKDFKALRISIASPDQILAWSYGEVKKPETINYRTHRAELDGLMDERIFGPSKNYECYCGKYKKIRYKGIVCDQCGVEVTTKRVRRERMGHIKLACPVTHVWYAYGIPNKLALILNIPQKKLETVIYYARYIVTDYSEEGKKQALETVDQKYDEAKEQLEDDLKDAIEEQEDILKKNKEELKKAEKDKDKLSLSLKNVEVKSKKEQAQIRSIFKQKVESLKEKFDNIRTLAKNMKEGVTLSEDEYNELLEYNIDFFDLGMGAEAIRKLLQKIDLDEELEKLNEEFSKTRSKAKRSKFIQRIRILKGLKRAGVNPTWVVMDIVPVLPPDLRPIIQLQGGRFATSDLNDLYRRVINRNNRLKRLMNLGAPEIILRNEKRMLQEAVDALIDNSHRSGNPVLNSRDQAYKSLSDMLRGKQGRFRQNLLGKRVDYSGRSVIVAGPELGIYECGLPKTMALELFKPFVLSEVIKQGLAPNIKSAKVFYDSKSAEVWDILEKVTKRHPVLLNRAPTLHKQGIQAFFPVLIEGNAIRIHPMVCKGFNADFDGDQMAVHVPLTRKAKEEVIERMFVDSNVLLMADGSPVVNVEKDMALGIFYLTGLDEFDPKLGKSMKFFGSSMEAKGYYNLKKIDLHETIKVLYKNQIIETSVGRLIFNDILPENFRFVNEQINKKSMAKLASEVLNDYGSEVAVELLDNVKKLGFKYATISGISVSLEDFVVSEEKDKLVDSVIEKESQLTEDFYMGLLTGEEKKRLVEEAWMDTIDKIAEVTWDKYNEKENNLVVLNESGATPVSNPLRQISGVKGLILDPQGRIVELPLRSNYKDGLTTLEYFVGARGTRKGLADTALKTAESGYLTRRLVDVAQDVITREFDCETKEGIWMRKSDQRRIEFSKRVYGRYLLEDAVDKKTGEIVVKAGDLISRKDSVLIEENENIDSVHIRSAMTCTTSKGVCRMCYGTSLGTGKLVDIGMAVGIVAAQAMGEAATQLTLDTKHLAGRAGMDITQGLPRVEELFESRTPKGKSIISEVAGKVKVNKSDSGEAEVIVANDEKQIRNFKIGEGDEPQIKRKKKVKKGEVVIIRKGGSEITAPENGTIFVDSDKLRLEIDKDLTETYKIASNMVLAVKTGDHIEAGDRITEGAIDPKELMKIKGIEEAQKYIMDNIQSTYGIQGIGLDDRHVEIIVRQMSRFVKITDAGEGEFLPGDYTDKLDIINENNRLREEGKKEIKFTQELFGITTASVRTESFLSAASFQEQVRVLTDAALIGKVDHLRGLKENVIIGRPVPLGKEVK